MAWRQGGGGGARATSRADRRKKYGFAKPSQSGFDEDEPTAGGDFGGGNDTTGFGQRKSRLEEELGASTTSGAGAADDNDFADDPPAFGQRASGSRGNAFGGTSAKSGGGGGGGGRFQSRSLGALAGKKPKPLGKSVDDENGDFSDPDGSVSSQSGGGSTNDASGFFGGRGKRNTFKQVGGGNSLRKGRLGMQLYDDDEENEEENREANMEEAQRLNFGPTADLSSDDLIFVENCKSLFGESPGKFRDPDHNPMAIVSQILAGIAEVGGHANDEMDQNQLLGQYNGMLEDADRSLTEYISQHYDHFSASLQNFSSMILNVSGSQDSIGSLQQSLSAVSSGLRNHSPEIQQLKRQGLRNVYVYRVLGQVQRCVGAVRDLQDLVDRKQYLFAVEKATGYQDLMNLGALKDIRPLVPVMEYVRTCPAIVGRLAMEDLMRCVYRKDKLRGIQDKLFGGSAAVAGAAATAGSSSAATGGGTGGNGGVGMLMDPAAPDPFDNDPFGTTGRKKAVSKNSAVDGEDFSTFIPMCVSTLHAVGKLDETHVAFFSASTKAIESYITHFLGLFCTWYKDEIFHGRISNPSVQHIQKRAQANAAKKSAGGPGSPHHSATGMSATLDRLGLHLDDNLDDESLATAQGPSIHLLLSTLLHELSKILRNVTYFTGIVAITQFRFLKDLLRDPQLRYEPHRWNLAHTPMPIPEKFNGIVTETRGATMTAAVQIDAKEGGTSYEQLFNRYWEDLGPHNLWYRLADPLFDPHTGGFNSAGFGNRRQRAQPTSPAGDAGAGGGGPRRKVTLALFRTLVVSTGERLGEKLPHLATDKRIATCRGLILGEFEGKLRHYQKQDVEHQLGSWDCGIVWAHINYHVEHLLGLLCSFNPGAVSSSAGPNLGSALGGGSGSHFPTSSSMGSLHARSNSQMLDDTAAENGRQSVGAGGTPLVLKEPPTAGGRDGTAGAPSARKTTLAAEQQFPTLTSLLSSRQHGVPKFLTDFGITGFSLSGGVKQRRIERRAAEGEGSTLVGGNSVLGGKVHAGAAIREAFHPLKKFLLLTVFNLPICHAEARRFVNNCLRYIPQLPNSVASMGSPMIGLNSSSNAAALQHTILPRLESELKTSFARSLRSKLLTTVRESLSSLEAAGDNSRINTNRGGHTASHQNELPCTHHSTSTSPILQCVVVAYEALESVERHLREATARGRSRTSHQQFGGVSFSSPSPTSYDDDMTVALRAVADTLMEEVTMALKSQLKREVQGTMADRVISPHFDDAFSHARTWQWTAMCTEPNLQAGHHWIDSHLFMYYQGLNHQRTSGRSSAKSDQPSEEELENPFFMLGAKSVAELRFPSLATAAKIAVLTHSAEWLSDRYLEFAFSPRLDGRRKGQPVLSHRTIVPGSKFVEFLGERNAAKLEIEKLRDEVAGSTGQTAQPTSKPQGKHARVRTTAEWTDGRKAALFHQLSSVAQAGLFYLSVDVRLAAFGFIPQLRDERYDFAANPGRADAFVLTYTKSLNRFFTTISAHLNEAKRKLMLLTLADPVSNLLIAELSRLRTKVLSSNGVEQLQRNVLTISQAIQLLLPFDEELRSAVDATLEKTRLYYTNLLNRNIVQDLIDTDLSEKLTVKQMENLVHLVFRSSSAGSSGHSSMLTEDSLAMVSRLRRGLRQKWGHGAAGAAGVAETATSGQVSAWGEEDQQLDMLQHVHHSESAVKEGSGAGGNDDPAAALNFSPGDGVARTDEDSVKVPSYPDTAPPSEDDDEGSYTSSTCSDVSFEEHSDDGR